MGEEELLQQQHRRALGIFVYFVASELFNREPSCTGCMEDMPAQRDHFCLNYGDGFDDDAHERETYIIQAASQLDDRFERESLVERWMRIATVRDISPTTTPAYHDPYFMNSLLADVTYIFLRDPRLCIDMYERGNLSQVPELIPLIRKAIDGTVFARMEI